MKSFQNKTSLCHFPKRSLRFFVASFFALAIFGASVFAQNREHVKSGAILHVWCWSFNTAKANMKDIADAGFSAIQFSPINTCLEGDYGGLDLLGADLTGKWYYHYQPTDWKIGNYQLGTRDEFIAACAEAKKYNIAVIVDVLPNHTTPRKDKLKQGLLDAVGGIDNLYHANEDKGVQDWKSRLQNTTYSMGGLPDVNTENPDFQAYFMTYMNDCIDCGAGGFRFDTAKHIGLPDDPKDPKAKENDFWPIFTGKKDIRGVMLKNANDLFIYGEVLQGGASREKDYTEYIDVVASSYGDQLRMNLKSHKLRTKQLTDWKHPAGGEHLVTWVESHDTYANKGASAKLTNFELRAGWAVIASRDKGTPLFFNRPQGPEATQFPGVSQIGDKGNDEFMNSEVVAVNKFRAAMLGEKEELINGEDASLLIIKRGEKGAVIINMDMDKAQKVQVPLALPDGPVIDKAHGAKFKAKGGVVTGKVPKASVLVIY